MSRSSGRLESIDVWRGLAALAVVAMHMRHDAPGGYREHPFFLLWFIAEYGYLGVPVFVMISGFCIHRSVARAQHASGSVRWGDFWKRRFWRLYPTYLAAIGLTLIVHAGLGSFARLSNPLDYATHLFMVHNLTDEFSTGLGNGVFWTLGMEEQLYALYLVLLWLMRGHRYARALLIVGSVTVVWRVFVAFAPDARLSLDVFHLGSFYHWPFFYWFHWALGAVLYEVVSGHAQLPRILQSRFVACVGLIAGLVLNRTCFDVLSATRVGAAWLSGYDRTAPLPILIQYAGEAAFALGCFSLLARQIGLESERRASCGYVVRSLSAIGRMSYSVYLIHIPILLLLERVVPFPPSPTGWILRALIYWPVILGISAIFHWCAERPFLRRGRVAEHTSAEPDHDVACQK